MGCGTCCLKTILILINILLGIIGLILLAAGIFVNVAGSQYINQYAGPVLGGLTQLAASGGKGGSSTTQSITQSLNLDIIISPLSIVLIVIGGFIAIIAFMGAFGACCSSKCLLIFYVVVMSLLIIAELVIVLLFFTKQLDSQIQGVILGTLDNNYVDITNFGVFSLAWNFVMIDFACCGLNGYTDFNNAKLWTRNTTFTSNGYSMSYPNQTAPFACCVVTGTFPDVSFNDMTCAQKPTVQNSNYMTGCWGQVTDKLVKYNEYVYAAVSVIFVFEFLVTLVAIGIACNIGKQKVAPK